MKRIFIQFIDNVNFRIVYQTNIENDFGPEDFKVNGFFLRSSGYPEVFEDGLFVLGKEKRWYNHVLTSRNKIWKKKLIEAVKKYNEIYR